MLSYNQDHTRQQSPKNLDLGKNHFNYLIFTEYLLNKFMKEKD